MKCDPSSFRQRFSTVSALIWPIRSPGAPMVRNSSSNWSAQIFSLSRSIRHAGGTATTAYSPTCCAIGWTTPNIILGSCTSAQAVGMPSTTTSKKPLSMPSPDSTGISQVRQSNQQATSLLRRGEIGTLLSWCRRMPEKVLLSRPEWALAFAWPLILIGNFDEAEHVLQRIKEMASNMPDDLLGQVMAAEAFLSRSQGDMERTIELSKKALTLIPDEDRASRGNIALNLGIITWHLGQLDDAEIALRDALGATLATGNDYAHHTALVFMARTHAARGNLRAALDSVEHAIEMGDRIPTAVLAHCDKAAILFEWNELKPAWEHLEQASEIAGTVQNAEFSSACSILRASFHLGLKQIEAAYSALAPALAYCQTKDVPLLTSARVRSFQVELALANGDVETAGKIHASIPLPHDATTFTRFIDLNTARIHLAKGEKGKARQGSGGSSRPGHPIGLGLCPASHPCTTSPRSRRPGSSDRPSFDRCLRREKHRVFCVYSSMKETNSRSSCRKPLDAGSRLGMSSESWMRPCPQQAQFLRRMGLIEALSERELEVLRLVAAGMSNRQVAEQLVVSLGTPKPISTTSLENSASPTAPRRSPKPENSV